MLARRGPTAELTSLWRFRHPWAARASLELRRAHPAVLDTYDAHGAITGGTRQEMLAAALDAWTDARENGQTAVLAAADNRTVRELNNAARTAGILAGTVTRDGVELHDGLVAGIGDRIITRHNHRHLHTPDGFVRNGALWDITAIGTDGSLRVRPAETDPDRDDRGQRHVVRLPADHVTEHVELGYATTTTRAQGITVDQTYTIAAPAWPAKTSPSACPAAATSTTPTSSQNPTATTASPTPRSPRARLSRSCATSSPPPTPS